MKRALVATAALLCIAAPALAQNVGSASNATVTNSSQSGSSANVVGNPIGNGASSSLSGATSASGSRSNSSATSGYAYSGVGNTSARTGSSSAAITINNGSGASDPSGSTGGGDPTINYTGGYTVHNVPEVIAPNIVGGNPCAVGMSGGVAVAGFGITGGGTWADRACERRQQAALLYNIGQHDASIALLCQDDHVRAAMYSVGQACGTRVALRYLPAQPATQAPATVVRPVAAAPRAVPVSVVAAPAVTLRPDWCDTVSGSVEQARYLAQCQWFPAPAVLARPHHRPGRVARNYYR